MNPDNTIATVPHTSVWVCGTGPAQQPQQQQNTLATICTQYGCQPLTLHGCQPTWPTGSQNTLAQYGCPPAAAQATPTHFNTAFTTCTQHVVCQPQQNANVSVPPHCPTVAPMCPPPAHGGGQAQAQFQTWINNTCTCTFTFFTHQVVCPLQQGQAQQGGQAQTQTYPPSVIGCPPTQQIVGCTTIAGLTHNPPMCPPPPANTGGQAQAQFQTWPIDQCITPTTGIGATTVIGATTSVLTAVAGCLPQQAQGSYYTMTCPAPQGQGQQQVLPHTIFPPLCQHGGGQTGAYTHHLMGCTTVTSNPNIPSTHFPGCTGVTATPATVGYTHLMGCTTVTSTPTTQVQGQGAAPAQGPGGQAGTLPHTYHPAGGCGPAANANGGQAQAQIQFPTIPPIACVATAAFNCGHVTGIPPLC